MRLFYSPDRPRTGDVLTLNANVMSLSGEALRDGMVIDLPKQIFAPSALPMPENSEGAVMVAVASVVS